MTTSINRRDLVKQGAAVVIGAGLAGGTAPVEATAAVPRRDMAAVFAWEDALRDADQRGATWADEARILRDVIQVATWQTEEAGTPGLAAPLAALMAEAEVIYAARSPIFQAWADEAWALPDLAPLPAEPWG